MGEHTPHILAMLTEGFQPLEDGGRGGHRLIKLTCRGLIPFAESTSSDADSEDGFWACSSEGDLPWKGYCNKMVGTGKTRTRDRLKEKAYLIQEWGGAGRGGVEKKPVRWVRWIGRTTL